jgi:hypothetical protein
MADASFVMLGFTGVAFVAADAALIATNAKNISS